MNLAHIYITSDQDYEALDCFYNSAQILCYVMDWFIMTGILMKGEDYNVTDSGDEWSYWDVVQGCGSDGSSCTR